MAELFSDSGQQSDVAVSSPSLQGIYIPAIDKPVFTDGFGLTIPWGGGSTTRKYSDYGISEETSAEGTQLSALSSMSFGGGGISYNLEGLVGPPGPAGPVGPQGLPGNFGGGLLGLNHTLEEISGLGTALDQMIYTDSADYHGSFGALSSLSFGSAAKTTVASSHDGSVLYGTDTRFYISTNSGANWTEKQPAGDTNLTYFSTVCSEDGSCVMTYATFSSIYYSIDYGENWTEYDIFSDKSVIPLYKGMSINYDGSIMAVAATEKIVVTTNSGASWQVRKTHPTSIFTDMVSSSSGKILVAGDYVGSCWISNNRGGTWTEKEILEGVRLMFLTMSKDGSIIYTLGYAGETWYLFKSIDSGINWSSVTLPTLAVGTYDWYDVSCDKTGSVVAISGQGAQYTSIDGGTTWTLKSVVSFNKNVVAGDAQSVVFAGVNTALSRTAFTIDYVLYNWGETTISEFGRALVDDSTSAEARTTLGLGIGDSPTFTGASFSGLSASRLVSTETGKALASADLSSWVAGTTNEIAVADDSDGSITISLSNIINLGGSI